MRAIRVVLAVALVGIAGTIAGSNSALAATSSDIIGPAGSGAFGQRVLVLSNGNFVVTDPKFSIAGNPGVGAVRLYDGSTRALISTLTGSTVGDSVGLDVTEVGNGNFAVSSPKWHNGLAVDAGAVTWVNGATGLDGIVTAQNSLVGTSAHDDVGSVSLLTNGNYVVTSPSWSNGLATHAGAATWASGSAGVAGPISATNSLVGMQANDGVGATVEALPNGNYVVGSPNWMNGVIVRAGAATWGNGTVGITGEVSTANSLYGTSTDDQVGSTVVALANGNYVTASDQWDNQSPVAQSAGAVTWGDGASGTSGAVSAVNSVVGSTATDLVGTVVPLANGNYVVLSSVWDNGAVTDAGVVRLGSGLGGTVGPLTPANSLVGSSNGDQVARDGIRELANGNFVVLSSWWDNGAAAGAGAVTWSSGTAGTVGAVSPTNSIVGATSGDAVGQDAVVALANGNYVVAAIRWDNGLFVDVGAARFADGNGNTVGAITALNSLHGSTPGDLVGYSGIVALTDGSYVVQSPSWDGPAEDAGAATHVDASGSTVGPVSTVNSLYGTKADDRVGLGTTALPDGGYVVVSSYWDNGPFLNAGAVTHVHAGGAVGPVSLANSLVGWATFDVLGSGGIRVLTNGNYLVLSPDWHGDLGFDTGAITWVDGSTGLTGPVTVANSLVGTNQNFGFQDVVELENGAYVVWTAEHDDGVVTNAGAVTIGGLWGVSGRITRANSVIGTATNGISDVALPKLTRGGDLVVGRGASNTVTLVDLDLRDYVPLPPARLADTRVGFTTIDGQFAGIDQRPLGSTLELAVAGRGGVAVDAAAVTLNVTVTQPTADGFATVFPCGSPRPTASNLNFVTGTTVPNAVVTKVGDAGKVCIFVSQAAQLVVDVNGMFPAGTSYVASNPMRVLDTRPGGITTDGAQQASGLAAAGSVTELQIAGRAGVPPQATAVVLNVTVTEPVAAGFATVFPCGTPQPPTASNLNYTSGLTTPNLVLVKIGTGGRVCIFTQSSTHLIADVNGFFPSGTTYSALNPARLLDTRAGFPTIDGQGAGGGKRPLGSVTAVHVLGRGGLPASATTAILNVTVTEAEAPGFVTVFPCGIDPPLASNLNFLANQNIPNAVVSKIGTNGDVCLFTSQPAQLVVDVAGYFP